MTSISYIFPLGFAHVAKSPEMLLIQMVLHVAYVQKNTCKTENLFHCTYKSHYIVYNTETVQISSQFASLTIQKLYLNCTLIIAFVSLKTFVKDLLCP